MRIHLHIGLEQCGASRLQTVLAAKRDQLTSKGVRFAVSPGNKNHTRLWMAVTDPDHVDPLRYNRGYATGGQQKTLYKALAQDLAREVETHQPTDLILSASQLCWLGRPSELERLNALLTPLSRDIRVVAFVDEQTRLLTRLYGAQILDGRAAPLDRELGFADAPSWWDAAQASAPQIDPQAGLFLETQGAPFWLDYPRLIEHWESVFGAGAVSLQPYDAQAFAAPEVVDVLRTAFLIPEQFGKANAQSTGSPDAAAWLARGRQFNALLLRLLAQKSHILPRKLWRMFLNEFKVDGVPIDPASLSAIWKCFTRDNKRLTRLYPALTPALFHLPKPADPWREADPTLGFRASQYLAAFTWRIDKASRAEVKARQPDQPAPEKSTEHRLPPLARQNLQKLNGSRFAPHNRLGAINEEDLAAAFAEAPPRTLPDGSSGAVILGCMKNEAPYIIEWVAYHRAIGVDNFLIYTNGCEDGTSEILDRLQHMGVLQHRLNDDWQGNSPQQWALDRALEEPVVQTADWLIHIDVDEFINIRCGNGTLPDLFAEVPDATNIAMTWRLFGHNGITELRDQFVIDQFDACAPKYCPKPHTVWGFKSMFKNTGAYGKISCHRPNKLDADKASSVKWVNGSGQDMTEEAIRNGWRNSKKSIGYDLVQLNHYALRSAESFLIKRQRGRALHVDRSIGLNYWIRMDWSDYRDITIKRNLPRLRAEYDRLMQDSTLKTLHDQGLAWHRAKADELHGMPEFQDLYNQALTVKLNPMERVAYALALDMES